jgi:aspartate aminotransferase-like enzyme
MKPTTQRMRLPGPTSVPERVRQALAEPALNHRGPEFREIVRETEEMIKRVYRTSGDVFFFACSGTGGMEAALVNTLAPGERVLILENGQFGSRFAAIAKGLGAQVDTLEAEWGTAIDPEAVLRRVKEQDYHAVTVIHNESSTGAVNDLKALGEIMKDRSGLLIVDAVSSLGAIDVQQENWHLDVVVGASQKAIMCPPGVATVSVNAKAWEVISRDTQTPRFFFDIRKAKASLDKNETPYTTPTSLVVAMRESLRMIHEEGLENVLARHERLSSALRAGCVAMGLKLFPTSPVISNAVTALHVPDGLEGGQIVKHLYNEYNTVIGGSRNRLNGRVIRIGTMGDFDADDILGDVYYLGRTLQDLGVDADLGAGAAAAAEVLAK